MHTSCRDRAPQGRALPCRCSRPAPCLPGPAPQRLRSRPRRQGEPRLELNTGLTDRRANKQAAKLEMWLREQGQDASLQALWLVIQHSRNKYYLGERELDKAGTVQLHGTT